MENSKQQNSSLSTWLRRKEGSIPRKIKERNAQLAMILAHPLTYHLQALEFFTLISNLTTKQFAILNRSFTFFYLSAIKRKKYSVSDAEHDNLEKC